MKVEQGRQEAQVYTKLRGEFKSLVTKKKSGTVKHSW